MTPLTRNAVAIGFSAAGRGMPGPTGMGKVNSGATTFFVLRSYRDAGFVIY